MRKKPKHKQPDTTIHTRTQAPAAPAAGEIDGLRARDLFARNFQTRADTIDEDARSVRATIATEAPVMVFDYCRGERIHEILVMAGCDIPGDRQIPLLDTHNRWTIESQLGSCRELAVEADELVGVNVFGRTKAGDDAWAMVRDGHITDNSVGYRIAACTYIEAGETAEVDGRSYTARELPLKIATRWSPHENSVCPIGADGDAKNRDANQNPDGPRQAPVNTRKEMTMKKYKLWLTARGLDYDTLTEGQRTSLKVDFDAEETRNAEPPVVPDPATPAATDPVEVARIVTETLDARALAEEAGRRTSITDLASLAGVGDETRDAAIADPTVSVTHARELFTIEMRAARPVIDGAPAIHVPASASDAGERTIEAALLCRGNLGERASSDAHPEYTPEIIDAGDRMRSLSMMDLCRHAIRLAGLPIPQGRDATIRAAISTGSLSNITSNVAGVAALMGGASVASTWRMWCSTGEIRNFQPNKLVRLDIAGNLSPVGADGKLAHINLEDTGETITGVTRGNILVLTRQVIIDDRIGILTQAPQALGRGAVQDISHTVYTILLANGNMSDGNAIFVDAVNNNLKTSCVLGPAGIQTAAAALAMQTTKKGLPRDLIPSVILVPPGQYSDAWSSTQQPRVLASSPSTSVGETVPAVHAYGDGSIQPVMESRLANPTYSGYNTTDWYLMASPMQTDNIQVAFLDGVQNPTVRQVEPGAGTLGVAFEVYIDYGVAPADAQGMIKCQE